MTFPMMAQSNDKKPGLHKENCTFVNKDGKTFNLYGKVKIVESFPDIKVQIVESFEDLDVKIVESFPDQCGKVKLVESFPDVKVQIVNSFPDIKVKIVESFPGVKKWVCAHLQWEKSLSLPQIQFFDLWKTKKE